MNSSPNIPPAGLAFSLSTAARADAEAVTGIEPGRSGFGSSTLG